MLALHLRVPQSPLQCARIGLAVARLQCTGSYTKPAILPAARP
jgi:hypothetical protein